MRICILLFSLLYLTNLQLFCPFILLLDLLFFFTSPLSPSLQLPLSFLAAFSSSISPFLFSCSPFPPHFLSFFNVSFYLVTTHPSSFPSFSYSHYSSYYLLDLFLLLLLSIFPTRFFPTIYSHFASLLNPLPTSTSPFFLLLIIYFLSPNLSSPPPPSPPMFRVGITLVSYLLVCQVVLSLNLPILYPISELLDHNNQHKHRLEQHSEREEL